MKIKLNELLNDKGFKVLSHHIPIMEEFWYDLEDKKKLMEQDLNNIKLPKCQKFGEDKFE